jgi:hypothetical protein
MLILLPLCHQPISAAAPAVAQFLHMIPIMMMIGSTMSRVVMTDAVMTKDGNFTHGYGYPRVPYPHGQGMGTLLYPRAVPIPYPPSHG